MSTSEPKPFSNTSQDFLHGMESHPRAEHFKEVVIQSVENDRDSIARLWLSEGIPYAFKDSAGVYDELRGYIARRLCISFKDITVLGSGRIGFSMKPNCFGRDFGVGSDLDLVVVNEGVFSECREAAETFVLDYKCGKITPSGPREKKNWDSTCQQLHGNIISGFVDTVKIPNSYRTIYKINMAMDLAHNRLKRTENCPDFKSVSVRIYKSWESLIKRVSLNLHCAQVKLLKE